MRAAQKSKGDVEVVDNLQGIRAEACKNKEVMRGYRMGSNGSE